MKYLPLVCYFCYKVIHSFVHANTYWIIYTYTHVHAHIHQPACAMRDMIINMTDIVPTNLASKTLHSGASLVVQWLRMHAPNARRLGSIPGQGTRSYRPQLRVQMLQLKILHVETKRSCMPQRRLKICLPH